MYPKFFIENFWKGDEGNEVFVCIPFDNNGEFDQKFEKAIKPAIEEIPLIPKKSGHGKENEITEEIIKGILKSKILLFDLSGDVKFGGESNGNVLFELGIASAVRNMTDVVLIKKETIHLDGPKIKTIFWTKDLQIFPYSDKFSFEELEGWINQKIKDVLFQKDLSENKLLPIAHQSLDAAGLALLIYKFTGEKNQIFESELSDRDKLSMLHLMDIGIIRTWSNHIKPDQFEFSYCLTKFGEKLQKYLIQKYGEQT